MLILTTYSTGSKKYELCCLSNLLLDEDLRNETPAVAERHCPILFRQPQHHQQVRDIDKLGIKPLAPHLYFCLDSFFVVICLVVYTMIRCGYSGQHRLGLPRIDS